jgi:thiamine biosynthesis protein ThiS
MWRGAEPTRDTLELLSLPYAEDEDELYLSLLDDEGDFRAGQLATIKIYVGRGKFGRSSVPDAAVTHQSSGHDLSPDNPLDADRRGGRGRHPRSTPAVHIRPRRRPYPRHGRARRGRRTAPHHPPHMNTGIARVVVNGEEREIESGTTLARLVENLSLAPERLAVEVNGEVVRRKDWHARTLSDNDRVEIVHFVGGGGD